MSPDASHTRSRRLSRSYQADRSVVSGELIRSAADTQ